MCMYLFEYSSEYGVVAAAVVMLWGGKTKPHAYAQEDAWEKILAFLWQHLYFSSNFTVKAKL